MQGTGDQFGYEWGKYTEILPEFEAQFLNWVEPLAAGDFRAAAVLDAGCGIGRNSFWALKYGAARVVACDVDDRTLTSARSNLAGHPHAEVVRCSIDALPWTDTFDVAMSIGVVHHVVDPRSAVANLVKATKPGGRTVIWVYGREGNELLLLFLEPLRAITKRLPPRLTHVLTYLFSVPLFALIKVIPTRHPYFVRARTWRFRHLHLVIFDQLLPRIAHYWTRAEALDLFRDLPVARLEAIRKNNNSWTVIAVRAAA
jgi:SAM-dependent methyltransferase